MQAKLVQKMSK